MTFPSLHTDRLLLRPWQNDDVELFVRLYADPTVTRFLGDGAVMTRAQAWRAVAVLIGHWHLRGYGQWIAVEKASGTAIGRIGLFNPEGWPGLEVGWVIDPAFQGRGYATEGGAAALAHAFDVVGADHVISLIQPANAASIRVAEKLGGRWERTIDVGAAAGVSVYGYDRPRMSDERVPPSSTP